MNVSSYNRPFDGQSTVWMYDIRANKHVHIG